MTMHWASENNRKGPMKPSRLNDSSRAASEGRLAAETEVPWLVA
jgi:hypothetical protein